MTDTVKKNTETLIDTNKEVDLEVNAGKTKCMLMMSHCQNAAEIHDKGSQQDALKMWHS
jgi:hypothetical protein